MQYHSFKSIKYFSLMSDSSKCIMGVRTTVCPKLNLGWVIFTSFQISRAARNI